MHDAALLPLEFGQDCKHHVGHGACCTILMHLLRWQGEAAAASAAVLDQCTHGSMDSFPRIGLCMNEWMDG